MKRKAKRSPTRPVGKSRPDGPPGKRLRLSDPDLSIVVGEGEQQKTYECYSQIMAMYSGYIDNALAMPMREQDTMTLTFPEINPDEWDKMMSYLLPGAAGPQSVDDVRVVLSWYDKYDFDSGLEICDRLLAGIDYNYESNLDDAMAAVELVYQHSHRMTSSKLIANEFLTNLLEDCAEGMQFFEVKHVRQLIPALRIEPDLWNAIQIFHQFPDDANADRDKYLDCLLFPELLLSCIKLMNQQASSRYHRRY
jgi:BTB/POZ domain